MKIFQIIISALTVFITVSGGAFLAVAAALGGQTINPLAYKIIFVTGLLATMKDIRATMSLPPLSNGNYAAISQLMKQKGDTTILNKSEAAAAPKV